MAPYPTTSGPSIPPPAAARVAETRAEREAHDERARRTQAARVLESYERLVWHSMARNEVGGSRSSVRSQSLIDLVERRTNTQALRGNRRWVQDR